MKRHQQILAAVLVVQVLLTAFVFWPRPATTTQGAPVFPDLTTDAVVALTVTDDQGNSVALRKVDDGWVLPDADDYPVLADSVTALLDKLVALTTDRLVTRTDTSHSQLQVAADNFVRRVEFETADGTSQVLYIGSAQNYTATHFRIEGQDETYLADGLSTYEINATPASWAESAYLQIPNDELTQVALKNANGVFTFIKTKDALWTLKELGSGAELSQSQVSTFISRVSALSLLNPLGKEEQPEYGMDEPLAVVTLKTADETVTLTVGAKLSDESGYVVKASTSPYYVMVAEYAISSVVENARADFLEAEPTPAPTTAP
ncbi:MAG: DUF4340 domain-containing protein [Anaerolineae bacterium]|jgi:hypothetical protein|nr:DUF4340 domain-containing protein [Anaerolineae bacterium]